MGDRHSRGASSVLTQFSCFFTVLFISEFCRCVCHGLRTSIRYRYNPMTIIYVFYFFPFFLIFSRFETSHLGVSILEKFIMCTICANFSKVLTPTSFA